MDTLEIRVASWSMYNNKPAVLIGSQGAGAKQVQQSAAIRP